MIHDLTTEIKNNKTKTKKNQSLGKLWLGNGVVFNFFSPFCGGVSKYRFFYMSGL